MRRGCVGSFTLRGIHRTNEFARPASAWLNHWTIRPFHHLDGFLIRGSGNQCIEDSNGPLVVLIFVVEDPRRKLVSTRIRLNVTIFSLSVCCFAPTKSNPRCALPTPEYEFTLNLPFASM